ncbi:host attachment protein [Falsiroseomonas sp.]|uniref:host attachment protein n=1 Tax=Falsiroseomonas sp. TaxID=2870721 RepID=UPI0034A31154
MPHATEWALLADAGHARVFARRLPAGRWAELPDQALENPTPPSRALGTERPGRVQESASTTRHAIEPRTDPHRAARRGFARRLAERLDDDAHHFASLLLVAPPAFLGELRAELGPKAGPKVAGSLDRDLVKLPVAQIAGQLDGIARAEGGRPS